MVLMTSFDSRESSQGGRPKADAAPMPRARQGGDRRGEGRKGVCKGGEDKKHEAEDKKKVQSDEGFDPLGQVVREGVEVIKEVGDEREGGTRKLSKVFRH